METLNQIDIRKVILNKNPRLARVLPAFAIRFAERLIHQDEINRIVSLHSGENAIGLIRGALQEMEITYSAYHFDRVPEGKRYVFVSNHPLGGLDGLILMDLISTRFPDFRFVVNDVLMNLPGTQEIFLPVNKFGRQKHEYVAKLDKVFSSDAQIIFFPAGLCSRRTGGNIADVPWNKTFLTKALQYHRDVVPIFFSGRNSDFFYCLANIRKFLGIRANLEMFLLPDEMFRQKGKNLSLVFGEPISWQTFDPSKTHTEWVEFVRAKVYGLS